MARKVKKSSPLHSLPSYKNPPVNEVVYGVRFRTPDNLLIPHIGILWEKFRAEYPIIQHAPPIATAKGEIKIDTATGAPIPRVWFINKSDDQLVQFQPDRFHYNWRRRQTEYPRYEHLIKNFEDVINNIEIFFKESEFGQIEPIDFELAYINHIPKGEGWNTIHDLPKIFSDFVWRYDGRRFLPNPQKLAWNLNFLLPEDNGNLMVSLKQGIRIEDKLPLLILELKATGIGESAGKEISRAWFDLAREWIVRGFTDLTTPEIQKIWQREDNA
jgi:uncharacterized protein (TIGR04255 family)